MCTPSNASGADPSTTASISFSVRPAESKAIFVASNDNSFPVSSIRRRNRVMPAPTIATRRFTFTALLVAQHRDSSSGRGYSSPALDHGSLGLRDLHGTRFPAELDYGFQKLMK